MEWSISNRAPALWPLWIFLSSSIFLLTEYPVSPCRQSSVNFSVLKKYFWTFSNVTESYDLTILSILAEWHHVWPGSTAHPIGRAKPRDTSLSVLPRGANLSVIPVCYVSSYSHAIKFSLFPAGLHCKPLDICSLAMETQ